MPFKLDEEQLAQDLQHAPSIKLLKADHAALIIGFLHQQFKYTQRVSIPLHELLEELEDYLANLNERTPRRFGRSAHAYITEWADQQHRFIHISAYGNNDTPMVELTADTERAIGWLEDMQVQHFIGTESRFLLIVQLLRDIIQNSTVDPIERVKQLQLQRAEIDRKINMITQTGQVDQRYSKTQLRERFYDASSLAHQLLRDFCLVEERFRDIARDLQKAQLQSGSRKGTLLEYVLDADARLKESDQGRSFYTFWEFLLSPTQGDELKALLGQLSALPELRSELHEDPILPRLSSAFINAGEKVVSSNARLAEQLRRLLDENVRAENRRIQELIQDIKHAAFRAGPIGPNLSADNPMLELEGPPEIQLVMERELWQPAKTQIFSDEPLETYDDDLTAIDFTTLYTQFSIDEAFLQQHIETLLEHQSQIRLSEILAYYPVRQGLAEVLTYCVLAARDARHYIDPTATEEISLLIDSEMGYPQEKRLRVPRIYYRRTGHAK